MHLHWTCIENALKMNCKPIENEFATNWNMNWTQVENKLEIDWKPVETELNTDWKSIEN